MKFHSARCEVCRQYVFDAGDILAYRFVDGRPEFVSLAGKQPWSGVQCICRSCLGWLKQWIGW